MTSYLLPRSPVPEMQNRHSAPRIPSCNAPFDNCRYWGYYDKCDPLAVSDALSIAGADPDLDDALKAFTGSWDCSAWSPGGSRKMPTGK